MVAWCLLVLIGTLFLIFYGKPQGPVASRLLPPNTYLLPTDLSYSGYDGRYIVAAKGVAQGATVSPADLGDQPNLLDGAQGRLSLLVNVDHSAAAGVLNAGSNTQLCGKKPMAYGAVTVQAVRCEKDKDNNRCMAMVELVNAGAGDVAAKALKDAETIKELRLARKCDLWGNMLTLNWSEIKKITLPVQDVVAAWTAALEELDPAVKYLRFKAAGKWTAMAGLSACGPDGLIGQSFPDDRLILTDCSVGALIGRIGGSSATLKGATTTEGGETKPFPIGCQTVVKLPDNATGPIYFGFNILVRPLKLESLELVVLGGS
jgi:hypothetical protein